MALVWYFVSVPKIPHEVKDQFQAVEIVQYLTPEYAMVERGTPIARVKTWWAVLDLISTTKGRIEKNLFDNLRGHRVEIGHPLSFITADACDCPDAEAPYCEVSIAQILKVKP